MQIALLPDLSGDGKWNMAVDEAMLELLPDCNYAGIARLYSWSEPTVTLGRNQRRIPETWHGLELGVDIPVVTRPTGGRAVIHLGELTMSLVFRTTALGCGNGSRVKCLHRTLLQFSRGLLLNLGITAVAGNHKGPNDDQFDCFSLSTEADLVDCDTNDKAAGAALVIRGDCVLQQVSLRAIQVSPVLEWPNFSSAYGYLRNTCVRTLDDCNKTLETVLSNYFSVVQDSHLAHVVVASAHEHRLSQSLAS